MSDKIDLFQKNLKNIIIQKKKYRKMILNDVNENVNNENVNKNKNKEINNILVSNLNTTIYNLSFENQLLNNKIQNINKIYISQINNLIEKTKNKFSKYYLENSNKESKENNENKESKENNENKINREMNDKLLRTMGKMSDKFNKYNTEIIPYIEKLINEKKDLNLNLGEINEKIESILKKY
jgi:hypothetical protein